MKRITIVMLIGVLLILTGCTNIEYNNDSFMLEVPSVDIDEYMIEKGSDSSHVLLADMYDDYYNIVNERYAEGVCCSGFITPLTNIDSMINKSDYGIPNEEEIFTYQPEDLTMYHNLNVVYDNFSKNNSLFHPIYRGFSDLANTFENLNEGEMGEKTTEFGIMQGKFLINEESMYLYYNESLYDGEEDLIGELLITTKDNKEVEYFKTISVTEEGTFYVESFFIEDEFSYQIHLSKDEFDETAFRQYYTDYEKNENHYIGISLEYNEDILESTFAVSKILQDSNVAFQYQVGEGVDRVVYSFLDEGEQVASYSKVRNEGEVMHFIDYSLRNINGYDFLGGLSSSRHYENLYLAKDNSVIDIAPYTIVEELPYIYSLRREISKNEISNRLAFNIDTLEFVEVYDFDIEETIDMFSDLGIAQEEDAITINGKKFAIYEQKFFEEILPKEYHHLLDN